MGSGGLLLEDFKAQWFPNICKLASCEGFEKADGGGKPRAPVTCDLCSEVRAEPVLCLSTRWRQQPSGAEQRPAGAVGSERAGAWSTAGGLTVTTSPERPALASGPGCVRWSVMCLLLRGSTWAGRKVKNHCFGKSCVAFLSFLSLTETLSEIYPEKCYSSVFGEPACCVLIFVFAFPPA